MARDNELSTMECIDVAEQLAELGCRRVSMIGGEVFMRKDWKQIVSKLTGLGISVNIITNGFFFNEGLIKDLMSSRVESVSVSVDGPKEIHDRLRQEGSFKRAMEAVSVLSNSSVPVSVISTLNRENVESLERLYEILLPFPIFAWQLQACSPMGNAASNKIDYSFDFAKVINFVNHKAPKAPFAVGVADNIGYFTKEEGSIRAGASTNAFFKGCSAGISAIGIDSVGNVRGCESMYDDFFTEGNLRKQSLAEIWNNPDNFAYNRHFTADMLTGNCKECEIGKYCGGGCRSYNYFVHKKLYESPFCARYGH